ncbi:hypothetical protein KC356_g6490 [Hortaea werneckii]|nr:hypothetical protein KC356_g6490 [Hortaea werneckii]
MKLFATGCLPLMLASAAPCKPEVFDIGANFANPPASVRPFFRYWVPDATVSDDVIDKDVEAIKRAGAGGFELLGFYNYGGTQSEPAFSVTDWAKYGWGTEAWRNTTRAALRSSKEHGLLMDYALGPNQGSGVPAHEDAEGLMLDLVPFNATVPLGGSFNDTLPGWGSGKFVSASIALVLESRVANWSATPGFENTFYYNGTRQVLASDSLEDVSSAVSEDGHVDLTFPSSDTGLEFRLFAFYQKRSGYREQVSPEKIVQIPQSPVDSYVQNGSWVNDHFSEAGANLLIGFWEDSFLDLDLRGLVREVGQYAWEDSMEFGTGVAVWWTPKMLEQFRSIIGYDFTKYLPLLYSHVSQTPGPLPSPDRFFTDDEDEGMSYLNDYYKTVCSIANPTCISDTRAKTDPDQLTTLNRVYLETLQAWAQSALQSEYTAQVVYNLPMEMAANIPAVGIPETESLGFAHLVDTYRQFSAPANLAGRNIISNELGAVQLEAYTQTLPELIWDTKLSIVGGVNRIVYHGYPYSGYYPNTTWPGYTTFYYRFSAMHGPRQPAWEYYDDYMNWTARMQHIAQSGVAKTDVAFWVYDLTTYEIFSRYNSSDMDDAGFTYGYISPSNFDLEDAYVKDGILAPERQAYKAFVVRQNDSMTLAGVQKLEQFASNGLPIVFYGGIPDSVLSRSDEKDLESIRSILENMSKMENVHIVPEGSLAVSLISDVGITPKVAVETNGRWMTYWREDEVSAHSYVILYNDGSGSSLGEGRSSGKVTVSAALGAPYVYDAWTGEVFAVRVCQQDDQSMTIPLSLAGNQTAILAFHHDEKPQCSLDRLPEGVSARAASAAAPTFELLNRNSATETFECHDEQTIKLPAAASAVELSNWTLVVESWTAPNKTSTDPDYTYEAIKTNSSAFSLPSLQPWSEISDSLRNTSGVGFYSTNFTWPPQTASDIHAGSSGAEIDLAYILNTARVWVNGNQVAPLDPVAPVADVSSFLVNGDNSITIATATTLGAAVREYWEQISVAGVPVILTAPPPREEAPQGLVAPVKLIPYSSTKIEGCYNLSYRQHEVI